MSMLTTVSDSSTGPCYANEFAADTQAKDEHTFPRGGCQRHEPAKHRPIAPRDT